MRIDELFEQYPNNIIGFRVNKTTKIIDFWLNNSWELREETRNGIIIKKQNTMPNREAFIETINKLIAIWPELRVISPVSGAVIKDIELAKLHDKRLDSITFVEEKLKDYTGQFEVIKVPNITNICYGRGVGYDIIEHVPPTEIGDISATSIREQMKVDGKL